MGFRAQDLVGTWSLVEWTIEYSDGRVTRPFQPDPAGYLMYTADGFMSAVIYTQRRHKLASEDVRKVDPADKARAFDEYFHYAGTWRASGDDVIHAVTASLNPNMIGTDQVRRVDLRGPSLTLSATENLGAGRGSRFHRLAWRRTVIA